MTSRQRSRAVVAPGPRAVELELLDQLGRLAPRSAAELAPPVRVVVPSASLRSHVLARLAAGGARAGVMVQTLQQLALEVLERSGEDVRLSSAPFEILVRRAAATDRRLRRSLADLDEPYGIVDAAVRDLVDAGFEPAHLEPVLDKVAELRDRVAPQRRERVGAVVRVAAAVLDRCAQLGTLRGEQAPQRAAELLRQRGEDALPARAVVVHGFADLTGVAADLVGAVAAVHESVVLVDRPPDPARPDREDAGAAFLARLDVQLGALARAQSSRGVPAARLAAFTAPTAEAEVRQVAHRVRRLLDGGETPEEIGVVARELGVLAPIARRHLDRLAIPFSGAGTTVPGGRAWRRARLVAAALASGPSMPAELWLEASGSDGAAIELLLALRTLGVARLDEVAGLAVGSTGVSLPLPMIDPEGEPRRERRVPAERMRAARARAAALVEELTAWPAEAAAEGHLASTVAVLAALEPDEDNGAGRHLLAASEELAGELPADLVVTRDEWIAALCRRLEELGGEPVGGGGGGIQLLSAMEARGRTFRHLFVVGLNRGDFPRVVQEDPLLPDEVRGHLAAEVLPEFPVKARGLDEERYLFAQLLAAADHVTLSWHLSHEGTAVAPSPFVERLRREGRLHEERAPAVLELAPDGEPDLLRPRPAFEHAVLAAEHGPRDRLAPVLAVAAAEGRQRSDLRRQVPAGWAEARVEVIAAIDPEPVASGPGPWAGLVGPASRPGASLPSITGFERLARCPLQMLLVRRLGMSPMPDPRLGLPDTRGMLVGGLVHSVLEAVVEEAVGRSGLVLDEAMELEPTAVPWPDSGRLERLLSTASETVARLHGLAGLGIGPLLAAQARPFLEVARGEEWGPAGRIDGVGAPEVAGEVGIEAIGETIAFRADRIDLGERPSLIDYKTGAPPSKAKTDATRRDHVLKAVARGDMLQAVAYCLAVPGGQAEGRYLYLKPELGGAPEAARHVRISSEDAAAVGAFVEAVAAVAEAWSCGAMFPRMEEPNGGLGRACPYCPVAEACLRDDSAVRRRLAEWLAADDGAADPITVSARRLWRLGAPAAAEDGP